MEKSNEGKVSFDKNRQEVLKDVCFCKDSGHGNDFRLVRRHSKVTNTDGTSSLMISLLYYECIADKVAHEVSSIRTLRRLLQK